MSEINRRNFNKLLSGIPFAGAILGVKSGLAATATSDTIPDLEVLNDEVFNKSEIGKIFTFVDCRDRCKEHSTIEFPRDFIMMADFEIPSAYNFDEHGKTIIRNTEPDHVGVPTWDLTHSYEDIKDKNQEYITGSLANEFISRITKLGWQTIKCAAEDRNIAVKSNDFDPKFISLMKTVMRRNGASNSTGLRRNKLTDLYLAKKHINGTTNWINEVDEVTKRGMILNEDKTVAKIANVNLHKCSYLSNYEVIGLDLTSGDNFVIPIESYFSLNKEKTEVAAKIGMAALSNLQVLAGRIN